MSTIPTPGGGCAVIALLLLGSVVTTWAWLAHLIGVF